MSRCARGRSRLTVAGGLAGLLVFGSATLASGVGGYDTGWASFVGGGTSSSAGAVMAGAIGAPAIGVSSSPAVLVEAGPLADSFETTLNPPGGGGTALSPRVFLPLLGSK